VAVELRRNAESLIDFVHPEHALYLFGPEDGSLGRATLAQCHRFLVIPTRHCANLSAAVYTVLYDRHAKRVHDGLELPHSTAGDFDEPDHMADAVGVTWGG
jgi:tRNA(Leu) C34 or U34 (ribose-2'-O)-methylase TrmL